MPNKDFVKVQTVNDLSSFFKLKYEDYKGFTGTFDDPILKDFTVIIKNHEQKIGRDIINENSINSLKSEKVEGLKFDKIPESKLSFYTVLKYIEKQYPNLKKKSKSSGLDIGINKEILYLNEINEPIVKVQYSKLGIIGTFVILVCANCADL